MKPDSTITRYLAEHAGEHGALPLPVLLVLLVGMFGLGALAMWKIGNVKTWLGEPPFPTHAATVVGALIPFLTLGLVATCRAALGMEWPSNYDIIVYMVISALTGVAAWGGVKRFTSIEAYEGKAKVEAAKAGTAAPADMTATAERRSPAGRATDTQAGVKPKNPDVVAGVEAIAANQHDPRLPSPLDDERD